MFLNVQQELQEIQQQDNATVHQDNKFVAQQIHQLEHVQIYNQIAVIVELAAMSALEVKHVSQALVNVHQAKQFVIVNV